jgi:hypothetical protein
VLGACTAFSLGPQWRPFGGAVSAGGLIGALSADYLLANFNTMGAMLATALMIIISIYLVSSFSMAKLAQWLAGPMALLKRIANKLESWRDIRRQKRLELKRIRAEEARYRAEEKRARKAQQAPPTIDAEFVETPGPDAAFHQPEPPIEATTRRQPTPVMDEAPPRPTTAPRGKTRFPFTRSKKPVSRRALPASPSPSSCPPPPNLTPSPSR